MHVTFDLSEIEEMMLQQARKQLETELETTLHSFGDVCCLYTAVLVSPVQSSPQSSPWSSPESSFYRDPFVTPPPIHATTQLFIFLIHEYYQ